MGEEQKPKVDDAALIAAVREGSMAAYGLLYAEFRPVGLRRARRLLGKHYADAEDVVEMAFASILDAIRNGAGPEDHFARYLMVTLRHSVWRVNRHRDRESPLRASHLDDLGFDPHDGRGASMSASSVADANGSDDPLESAAAASEGRLDPATLLSEAFAGLTERHRAVLWMSEVEGASSAEIAALLGMTDNSASALRYRARRSLRTSYFAIYAKDARPECAAVSLRLAPFIEAGMTTESFPDVLQHLESCRNCRDAVRGVTESTAMLSVLAPFGILSAGYWLRPDRASSVGGGANAGRAVAAGAGSPAGSSGMAHVLWSVAVLLGLIGAGASLGRCDPPGVPPAAPPVVQSETVISTPNAPMSTVRVPETPSTTEPARPDPTVGSLSGAVRVDRDGTGPGSASEAAAIPVRIAPLDGGEPRHAVTGTDGHYGFERLPPGEYLVEAMVPVGLAPAGSRQRPPVGGGVHTVPVAVASVEAGVDLDLDLLLEPWRSFSVSAVGATPQRGGGVTAVSWQLRLTSTPASSSRVRVVISVDVPVGAKLRDATVSVRGPSASAGAGGETSLPCEVRPGSARVEVICWLDRLTPTGSTLDVDLWVAAGSSGAVRPVIAVHSGEGFVGAATVEGPAVVLG